MNRQTCISALAAALVIALSAPICAGEAVKSEDGKYFDAEDVPTYKVQDDGTVDWYTYSGFRRYHSECHVCHGPDGLGSTFAPPLADSMKSMSYDDFTDVVVNGREVVGASQQSKMPGFGTNLNVLCFMDDLWVYLKARADGAVPRGRPRKKEAKSEATRADERDCMEG
ncbi:MAG: c-type cytochrome, methanol metabolism-related [Hyphomicrobiales bacterium]